MKNFAKRWLPIVLIVITGIVLFAWLESTLSRNTAAADSLDSQIELLVDADGHIADAPTYFDLTKKQAELRADSGAYTPFKALSIAIIAFAIVVVLANAGFIGLTKIDFIKLILAGKDKDINDDKERAAALHVLIALLAIAAVITMVAMFLMK
jgi:hypothetical protein